MARQRLAPIDDVSMRIDEFEGECSGLVLAEAGFKTTELLTAFPGPGFVVREVTDVRAFTGGHLVRNDIPSQRRRRGHRTQRRR